jgi:GH15 family glucan-1,4-alpha-glucosidase
METELVVRFGYGAIVPWVRRIDGAWTATAGPDSLQLLSPVELVPVGRTSRATFAVGAGEVVPFTLSWHPSHEPLRRRERTADALAGTIAWWERWCDGCRYTGRWHDALRDSLIVLKGLTNHRTGGLVAAATTSLPEHLGGVRNWDYRFCWLRDATFTLLALVDAGFVEEAGQWREWLLRAVAGDVSELQIMYGIAGERRLTEYEVDWLPGYAGSGPVRIGNAAHAQFQLDVYGEVLDCLYQAGAAGLPGDHDAWSLQRQLVDFVDGAWSEPDEGIWEMRGPRRHFTHSKVMAWVAVDRAIRSAERAGLDADLPRWRALRSDIHRWVLDHCVDDRGVLVQHPGSRALDASNLVVPLVGFLPVGDPRVQATVEAIQRELDDGGLLRRYAPDPDVEGIDGEEGAFLLCSFWLADCLHLMGRAEEAEELFERLLGLRNDVGLLSEQVDPSTGRFLGNFPQAFSHTAVVNTATTLATPAGGARHRQDGSRD